MVNVAPSGLTLSQVVIPYSLLKAGLQARLFVVALRDIATLKTLGRFGTLHTTKPAKPRYVQRRHFGPVIALAHCNMFGTGNKAEWDTNTT